MSFRTDPASCYREIRRTTEWLCESLSPEDCTAQSMTEASPVKWHLAHTSWFFERLVLERVNVGFEPFHPAFRYLFNSYYNTLGEQYPRMQRGLVTRPGLDEIRAYRAHVDALLLGRLEAGTLPADLLPVVEVGLHHEQQHQELLLTDVKHLFSFNPLRPAVRECSAPKPGDLKPIAWHRGPDGVRRVGHGGQGFSYDNEGPRHRVFLEPFEISSRPVTNGEFLAFMEDEGYGRPELWLSDGWATVAREGWTAPLYWEQRHGEWSTLTLSGERPLRQEDPVTHVSYYEADAFARWFGARLPTEQEWEVVAAQKEIRGNFLEDGILHPACPQSPGGQPAQLFGDVWEWTGSAYAPHPGYQPPTGALGEYNGKFMSNQMVLRGGSCATSRSHIRASYRNFFYPNARWQFSGIRLARDTR